MPQLLNMGHGLPELCGIGEALRSRHDAQKDIASNFRSSSLRGAIRTCVRMDSHVLLGVKKLEPENIDVTAQYIPIR
eukprot:5722266-Amphidinium_carterae.1